MLRSYRRKFVWLVSLVAVTLAAMAFAGCLGNEEVPGSWREQAVAAELPHLAAMFSPLITGPSAWEQGGLLLAREDTADAALTYYWFLPGKPPENTGMRFDENLPGAAVKMVPLLTTPAGSIIWGSAAGQLRNAGGTALALQTRPGAPLDLSFSDRFPGLTDELLGHGYSGIALYLAGDEVLVLEAKGKGESDYFLLVPGEPPQELPLPEEDIACHGYDSGDLSLVLFTAAGKAYRLGSGSEGFVVDSSMRPSRSVPKGSSCVVGRRYLWVSSQAGVEGIPLDSRREPVLLPKRDLPEGDTLLNSSLASDKAFQAMHQRRKEWASARGAGLVSYFCSLTVIGDHILLVDAGFHRILELEPE